MKIKNNLNNKNNKNNKSHDNYSNSTENNENDEKKSLLKKKGLNESEIYECELAKKYIQDNESNFT
ncbi:MAG: hypothetical protein ACLFPL_05480 [Candidatus Nanoarchaeia archaeon]